MDFIFDNIFIIVLLFVGAITQWLKARGEARQNQDTGYDPADLEEMMKEAQRSYPHPAAPPPLPPNAFPESPGSVIASAAASRRKSREPESATTASDSSTELARQQQLADKLKEMKRTRGAREISDSLLPQNRSVGNISPAASASLKLRLGNRKDLRQAFILKEILEKPSGLR